MENHLSPSAPATGLSGGRLRTVALIAVVVSCVAGVLFVVLCVLHAGAHYATTEALVQAGVIDLEKFSAATGRPAELPELSRHLDQGYSPRIVQAGFVAIGTALGAALLFARSGRRVEA